MRITKDPKPKEKCVQTAIKIKSPKSTTVRRVTRRVCIRYREKRQNTKLKF